MPRTFIRQDTQIRRSDVYDDTIEPTLAAYETNPVHIEDDLNSLRSQVQNFLNRDGASFPSGNWYADLVAPTALETGTARGINANNAALHLVEKKRVLKCVWGLKSISIASPGDTFDILGAGELPGNTTAAVGSVTTLGTVVAAHTGTFGTASLDEVSGPTAISPKNLVQIVDASTRDPLLDAGDQIYGLLQSESAVDGSTITDTTPNRVQISFVKVNGTGNGLIAITSGAMNGVSYDYCYVERVRLEDLNESDFLGGANVDVPAGSNVTRQVAYDNQGATPVDLTTNAFLDLEGAGLGWFVRDDLEANLFGIVEGSAGGTSQVNIYSDVDEFDVDAAVNDFAAGVSVRSGGTRPIDLGVNDGLVETTAGDLEVKGAADLRLNDQYMVSEATWTGPGVQVSASTAEVTAYEAAFGGEVSLFNALVQANNSGGRGAKVYAIVTSDINADTDAGGVGGGTNLDAQLPDMSGGNFLTDYDVFVNGELQRPGADASSNHDYYPGTSLANGQLRFEYKLKSTPASSPDVIAVVPYA